MADNAPSAAVSEEKADNTPQLTNDTPLYAKDYLVNSGVFSFVDKNILDLVLNAGEEITINDAKEKITDFKGAK